jgi:hypothetical protein
MSGLTAHRNEVADGWPSLPLAEWKDTCDTLHMWTQIAGKVRMALTPPINHFWNVPFYVTARGLSTSLIPYKNSGFEILFDFVDHDLSITTAGGPARTMPLRPQTVAAFYREFMLLLDSLGIKARIHARPDEVPNPIPFAEDVVHKSYDSEYANRFWRTLVIAHNLMLEFRSRFTGKCSPVHFFWGSFDLAVSRFSGRRAPARPGADSITREAYSHEVSSVGWWPGGGEINDAAFYSYMAPEPTEFGSRKIRPQAAFYQPNLHEFFLMYEEVRRSATPQDDVLNFFQSTYDAGAKLAHWEDALENGVEVSRRIAG